MNVKNALIMCILAAANLGAALEIALSKSDVVRAIAAFWIALLLIQDGTYPGLEDLLKKHAAEPSETERKPR